MECPAKHRERKDKKEYVLKIYEVRLREPPCSQCLCGK